ncbi:hypothetical protein Celaphus_00011597, partial [Cervus elaphus hippelaphus]
AGIGRTGCFIATSIGCRQLREEGVVDALSIVCQLRIDSSTSKRSAWWLFLFSARKSHPACETLLVHLMARSQDSRQCPAPSAAHAGRGRRQAGLRGPRTCGGPLQVRGELSFLPQQPSILCKVMQQVEAGFDSLVLTLLVN